MAQGFFNSSTWLNFQAQLVGKEDMARSRSSALVVLLAVVGAAALFAGVCSFVGPTQQQRELDVSRSFFGAPEPAPAPAPPPPPPAPVVVEGGGLTGEQKALILVFGLLALLIFPSLGSKFPTS